MGSPFLTLIPNSMLKFFPLKPNLRLMMPSSIGHMGNMTFKGSSTMLICNPRTLNLPWTLKKEMASISWTHLSQRSFMMQSHIKSKEKDTHIISPYKFISSSHSKLHGPIYTLTESSRNLKQRPLGTRKMPSFHHLSQQWIPL
jgi:hypothetical protein